MTALLLPHSDVSMRPDDKDVARVFDLDDLFDQYVETDLPRFSEATAEASGSNDLAHTFEFPSNENHPTETSAIPDWATGEDAWHKALHAMGQNPASPSMSDNSPSIYPESHGRGSTSEPALLNFDDLFELEQTDAEPRVSHSTPSTPKPEVARTLRKVASVPDRSIRAGIQKSTKKISAVAKMMRPSHFRANIQDMWTRKMDTPTDDYSVSVLPIGLSHSSSSSSSKVEQHDNAVGFTPRDPSFTIALTPNQNGEEFCEAQQSNYQLTPLTSPTIDFNSRSNSGSNLNGGNPFFSSESMATGYMTSLNSHPALSAFQTPPPTSRMPISTWGGSETPANLEFSFSTSPDYQALSGQNASNSNGAKTTDWWTNGASLSAPQPSPHNTFQPPHSRASSHNATMSFSPASASAGMAGLGISCDSAPFSGFVTEESASSATTPGAGYGHSLNLGVGMSTSASSSTFDLGFAQQAHMYAQPPTPGIPIGRPNARTPSRTPSPTPAIRFSRRRHSAHNSHNNLRDAASCSANAAQAHHRRRKSSSHGLHHQRSNSAANVGFVNFTPDDSRKILTGVAPSGSSKTKARREKEAADKRRKLSQAAMKAVIEAGGDIRQLEEGGLLSLGIE